MIVTGDTNLFLRLRQLKDQGRQERGSGGDDEHPAIGFNFKYTNLQAAIAMAQMDRLEARLAHFNERNLWYHKFFDGCEGLIFPGLPSRNGEVLLWRDALIEDREKVEKIFQAQGIGFRNFWRPLHQQAPYREENTDFPHAIEVAGKGLWLPSSFHIAEGEVKEIAEYVGLALS
jgi:perosamine synthetase